MRENYGDGLGLSGACVDSPQVAPIRRAMSLSRATMRCPMIAGGEGAKRNVECCREVPPFAGVTGGRGVCIIGRKLTGVRGVSGTFVNWSEV